MPRVGEAGVREAEEKMLAVGESPAAVVGFRRRYERLEAGDEGLLREAGIEPVAELPGLDELDVDPAIAQRGLEQAVVVKVNGGLGTSMGLRRTKSLLEVKEGRTFLDVIAAQVLALRARHGARVPLVPPSLVACERLVVRGDVTFGRDVVVRGRVELSADLDGPHVPAGAVLEG